MASHFFGRGSSVPVFAAIAGLALPVSAARAQTLLWNNPAGGSAATAGNWSPAQVPGAGNILNFNISGSYPVSFPAAVPASLQQNFNAGAVTLSAVVPHAISGQMVVGLAANSASTVTLANGSLTVPVLAIAVPSTANGLFNAAGVNTDIAVTGPSGVRVGLGGAGTMAISSGASVRSTNAVTASFSSGSQGAISVTGISGGVPSELVTLDPVGGDLTIGQAGPATLSVSDGALVDIAGDAFIAPTAPFVGSATIGSAGGVTSLFRVDGDLHLGHNSTAAAAGAGSLTLNSGGSATVTGSAFVGDSAGGTGTLNLREGADLNAGSFIVDPAHGVFNHTGGSLRIFGGTFSLPTPQLFLNGTGANEPRVFFVNSSAAFSAVPPARAITLGATGRGFLSVDNHAIVDVSSGDVVMGDQAGSTGTLQIQLSGVMTMSGGGTLTVGNAGSGTILMLGGASLSCGSLQAGVTGSGSAAMTVVGSSTALNIAGTLALGGTLTTAAGTAQMSIGSASPNSGTVTVTSGSVPDNTDVRIWPGGSLLINAGGRLATERLINCAGSLTLAGGTIDARNLALSGAGPYPFAGTIVSLFQPGVTAVVNLTGRLDVGLLLNDGVINVGDQTLNVLPDGSHIPDRFGNCTIGSLGRVAMADGAVLFVNRTLSGDGTVDADIANSGTITATGSGLTLNGMVTGLGQGINGTAIQFGAGGGFTGAGAFGSTDIHALVGSTIVATGPLTMGNAGSAAGFVSEGQIAIPTSVTLTLRDLDRAIVNDVDFTDTDPGDADPVIRCPAGLSVRGLVRGTGVLDAFTVAQEHNPEILRCEGATLSPGDANSAGLIELSGNTVLDAHARTEIDVFDAATHDQVRTLANLVVFPNIRTAASDITLGGTLVLRVAPGHVPTSGESHQIIGTNHGSIGSDGAVIGGFDAVQAPPYWHINVAPDEVSGLENGVFAVYCPADFNNDGFVDFFDADAYVEAFESGEPEADFNGDGFLDFFDVDQFTQSFEIGC